MAYREGFLAPGRLCDRSRLDKIPQSASIGLRTPIPPLLRTWVDHGRLDAPVAEELLDRPDVIAIEQKVGRKAVPK